MEDLARPVLCADQPAPRNPCNHKQTEEASACMRPRWKAPRRHGRSTATSSSCRSTRRSRRSLAIRTMKSWATRRHLAARRRRGHPQRHQHRVDGGNWQGRAWCQRKNGDLFMTTVDQPVPATAAGAPAILWACSPTSPSSSKPKSAWPAWPHFDMLTGLAQPRFDHGRAPHAVSLVARHDTLVGVISLTSTISRWSTMVWATPWAGFNCCNWFQRLRQRVREEDTTGPPGETNSCWCSKHLRHPQQAAHVAKSILTP